MAEWKSDRSAALEWCRPISSREEKEAVARRLSTRLTDGDVVGIGSGSTSFLTLVELAARAKKEDLKFSAIATSIEIERACTALDVPLVSLDAQRPDWSFDGADEVDPSGRMIKGRGGAMFREKLLMAASQERFIVVDKSKMVDRLGQKFRAPVEVVKGAVELVLEQLGGLGMSAYELRLATSKDGPVITEMGGLILDVAFSGEVPGEREVEALPGVLATGIFDLWKFKTLRADDLSDRSVL